METLKNVTTSALIVGSTGPTSLYSMGIFSGVCSPGALIVGSAGPTFLGLGTVVGVCSLGALIVGSAGPTVLGTVATIGFTGSIGTVQAVNDLNEKALK
jgi:hypothetical protein